MIPTTKTQLQNPNLFIFLEKMTNNCFTIKVDSKQTKLTFNIKQ